MFLVRRPFASVSRIVVLSLAAPVILLLGQDASWEGKRIAAIQFDPVQQPLDPAEINQMLAVKRNQPLRLADVRASIERMFATGRYADIQVDAEPYQDGVVVRFLTKNSWFIGHVAVGGKVSSPPNTAQLENAAQLDLGAPYTEASLTAAEAGQKKLLESNGLFGGVITPVLTWENDYQQVHIRFNIDGGVRARFAAPTIVGNVQLDRAGIVRATGFQRWLIHTWKPMTQTRLRDAMEGVRALYAKDHRLEAKVTLEDVKYDAATNRAVPVFDIDAGPRIRLRAIGARISERSLGRFVPIFEERSVDADLLTEGAHNLGDYFQSKGYFDAEVAFKQQRVIDDQATIDYLVNLGERHKLVFIGIQGNRYFPADDIRERMFLRTASWLQFPHGRFSADLLRRDEDSIINLYQSNGFRDVKVTDRLDDRYQGHSGEQAVWITIDEGAQTFVNSLTVDGIGQLDKAKILSLLSSVANQPFSEFNVAVDRDAILAQYYQNGFPNATFTWSSKPAAPNRLDLRYTISEGGREFVRQVIFNPGGLAHTRPSLVYRNLQLNPGDPLSPTAMSETERRLYDLGVFSRVDMGIQNPDGETDQKYVIYDLEEARRYSVSVGVGAEFARIGGCAYCLDAPAGETGFSPRISLGVTRTDLWGIAHTLSLRTRFSTLEQQAILNYDWARFRGNDKLLLTFTARYDDSKDVRTFSFKREEASMQLKQRVDKSLTLLYRYTYRAVDVNQATLKISPELIPLLSQPVRLGLLSFNLIQDRRDDPLDPHKGVYNTLNVDFAEHIFGSQRDFVRVLARNSTYHQLGRKLVLARSTEIGNIAAFHYSGAGEDAVPLPERFFGGGAASDRAFPEDQSGPRDPETGFPIGGNAMFFNQTELRFPLIGENVGGVLFHDFGNTFTGASDFSFRVNQDGLKDFDYMVHAVGFGVRYRTPIGPFRVDLAYGINPPRFYGFKGTEQDLVNAGVNPCQNVPNQCTEQSVSRLQFFFSIGQTF
ncbi:MAG: BamA/TamA family outer membrane protein [Bryobacteraceae bacterium]